ncbi:MAG: FtsW/RodA/SpoVE family cell cycle protein, partial [Desulfarculaceae bacterium]
SDALLAVSIYFAVLGTIKLVYGSLYLGPLNRSLTFLLASLTLCLATYPGREDSQKIWPFLLLALFLVTPLLAWLGLSSREVVGSGWTSLASYIYTAPVAAGIALGALWLFGRQILRLDPVLIAAPLAFYALGLAMLQRLGAEYQGAGREEVLSVLALRHLIWFVGGLGGMLAAYKLVTHRRLARLSRKKYLLPLLAAGMILLTWQASPEINGRRLWLTLGPLSIQTVEIVKVLVVLFAAGYFSSEFPHLAQGGTLCGSRHLWQVIGPWAFMFGLPLLALIIQNDFGPAVLLFFFFLMVSYFASGSRLIPWLGMGLVIAATLAGYHYRYPLVLFQRVEAWLAPFEVSEHLTRGLWSIASGGMWGTGWGMGQPHTVPLAYSDFIFSGLCEELGFGGILAFLGLWAVFVHRGIHLARQAIDPQAKVLASGIVLILSLQALLVMGGVSGLIPLMGLTLPFVSHGGTSLVVNFVLLGILMRAVNDIQHV